MVSHDRHLLRTVSDEFYIVHDGRAQPFDGDLEDYAKWLADAQTASETAGTQSDTADSRKQRKREEAERRNRLTPLREAVARCERELERLARELAAVRAQLGEPDVYADDCERPPPRACWRTKRGSRRETGRDRSAVARRPTGTSWRL